MENILAAQVEGSTIRLCPLVSRIDAANAGRLKEQIAQVWVPGLTAAAIDMSRVDFVDSTGVGALLGVYRRFPEGSVVTLDALRPQVLTVIELLRLHRIFQIQR